MASNTPAFKAALTRILFTNKSAEALIGEGIVSLGDLMSLSSEDIKILCKVIREDAENEITFMNQKYLDAMRIWVQEKDMFNIEIRAADFNIAIAKELLQRCARKKRLARMPIEMSPRSLMSLMGKTGIDSIKQWMLT